MDGGRWDDLDGAAALALLEWQLELGADEPVLDAPLDRFAVADRPIAPAAAPPVATPAAEAEPDLDGMVAEARRLAEGAQSLDDLAAAQEAFDGIELKKGAGRFVFSDGNRHARVLILGEAPGEEEDRQGRPFVGRAGQLLDQMFAAIGMARDHVDAARSLYITNVLPWRPLGNRDPSDAEMALMMPFVRRHVELIGPDLVVLMGNTPCQAALGKRGILRLRGIWTEAFGRPALPMTHPAYLLRNAVAKREAWADLLSLQARLETLSI